MKVNKILFISIVVIVFIVTLLVILIRPNEIYDGDSPLRNANKSNNNSSKDSLDLSYLRISGVYLESGSSYQYCNGTIAVSSYSPYKYHFIKLKAKFLDNYGKVIDTDWTYGIDSSWLEPGESNKFSLSAKFDYRISKCEVTLMVD